MLLCLLFVANYASEAKRSALNSIFKKRAEDHDIIRDMPTLRGPIIVPPLNPRVFDFYRTLNTFVKNNGDPQRTISEILNLEYLNHPPYYISTIIDAYDPYTPKPKSLIDFEAGLSCTHPVFCLFFFLRVMMSPIPAGTKKEDVKFPSHQVYLHSKTALLRTPFFSRVMEKHTFSTSKTKTDTGPEEEEPKQFFHFFWDIRTRLGNSPLDMGKYTSKENIKHLNQTDVKKDDLFKAQIMDFIKLFLIYDEK